MLIKHAHKSLVNINEKTSTLFVELISILVNQVCILTMILTLSFLYKYDRELVKRNTREVRQAPKSTTGTLRRSLEITRWSVNTLPPRNIRLENSDF